MSLIKCAECGTEVSTTADACPKCGAKVPKPKKTKWWLWVPLGLVAAFFTVGFIGSNTPEGRAQADERAAIELCWQEQQRKSLDPGSQRFVAGACEMMERKYIEKHGRKP